MDTGNPFEILKQEMDNDDLSIRINTIHKVPIIATLMSPDAIKSNLIPYLDALSKKEEDQVVFAIAEEYANLAPMLGNQHTIVLPYLENLCSHEETVIRDRAVTSITKLFGVYSDNEINNFIIPMIIRLASNDVNFTSRLSATLLMCNVYPRAGVNREKIRSKFMDISNEEMLLLQRVTATKLSQMCQVYEKEYVLSDLISILKHRSTDQQDQIRVLATESFKAISKVLTRDENKTYIMPLIIQAAQDKSWRVRLCLAKNFTQIAENFGKEVADLSLIQIFGHLLKDTEVDVKIEAVKSLDEFVKIVSPEKMQVLIPQVIGIGKDPLSVVRCHSGVVLSSMMKYISKDQAYQAIQPLVKELMKDENQEVRKGALLAAVKFIEVLGVDSINSFIPLFKQIMEDTKWRVRLELLRNIINLSVKCNSADIFLKYLEPFYTFYLHDRAHAIRKLGASRLQELTRIYSKQWIPQFFARLVDILNKDSSYHYKITAIYSLKEMCMDPINEQYLEKALQIICKASNEKTPNIRQACVKCFHNLILRWEKGNYREIMRKQLALLADDPDMEVREKAREIMSRF